ncbi:MAG TPA: sortase [Patescibacteria group bacterium]|nr:sortase [Patescibacteria group bacterium]
MALKSYTKQHGNPHWLQQYRKSKAKKNVLHRLSQSVIPILLLAVGGCLLGTAVWPVLSYSLFPVQDTSITSTQSAMSAPQAQSTLMKREYLFPTPKPTPVVVAEELDFTDLSNWFPQHQIPDTPKNQVQDQFSIEIPKVRMAQAIVTVGGTDLNHGLIQYPGTAKVGDTGAPVIFGHSVLRQFYDPSEKNPRRYLSIFSTIMTLERDDAIIIKKDGVVFHYRVTGKYEVQPDDARILAQDPNRRMLKLITCVPEGTILRRGVVEATLEEVTSP